MFLISIEDAKIKVEKQLNLIWSQLEKLLLNFSGFSIIKPKIQFCELNKNIAGLTYFQQHIIKINIYYLTLPIYNNFLKFTLLHQLAHSLAYDLFKQEGHRKNLENY